jgi:hypothetical protein
MEQRGSPQVSMEQVSASQVGSVERSVRQIRQVQISVAQLGPIEVDSTQTRVRQIGRAQISVAQVGMMQVRFAQRCLAQISPDEVRLHLSMLLSPLIPRCYSLAEQIYMFLVRHQIAPRLRSLPSVYHCL